METRNVNKPGLIDKKSAEATTLTFGSNTKDNQFEGGNSAPDASKIWIANQSYAEHASEDSFLAFARHAIESGTFKSEVEKKQVPIERLLSTASSLPYSQRQRLIFNGDRSLGTVESNRIMWSDAADSFRSRVGDNNAVRLQEFVGAFTEEELYENPRLSKDITLAIEHVGKDCLVDQDGPMLVLSDGQIETLHEYIGCKLDILREELSRRYEDRISIDRYLAKSALLTKAQAVKELRDIVAANTGDGIAAYLYTNGVDSGLQHVDAALIVGHRIANLVPYTVDFSKRLSRVDPFHPEGELPEIYTSALEQLVPNAAQRFSPQASSTECATLSFLAALIYAQSEGDEAPKVFIDSLDSIANKKIQFFVPHPTMLGYSQSNLYNKLTLAFVNGLDHLSTVEHKGDRIDIRTLESFSSNEINGGEPFDKEKFRNWFNDAYCDAEEFRSRFDILAGNRTTNVNLSHANELLFGAKSQ